jgi:Protein of unknown function (DUF433)
VGPELLSNRATRTRTLSGLVLAAVAPWHMTGCLRSFDPQPPPGRLYTPFMAATTRIDTVVNVDPEILSGVAVFAATRVPVKTLFAYLEAGDGLDEFSRASQR